MFCEKCGAKNEKGANFCEKCGNKMVDTSPLKKINNENSIINKFKKLSKKTKIIIGVVTFVVLVALGILYFYFNTPTRVVERNLKQYFETSEKSNLSKVRQVFKNNKNNESLVDELKETTKNVFNSWIDEFNKSYEDEDKLEKSYNKYKSLFTEIYEYFSDSDYMMSSSFYLDYLDKIYDLYDSKANFIRGSKYKSEGDDYNTYYYFKNVIESDCNYNDVKDFISEYLKDEIDKLKNNADDKIKNLKDDSSLDDIVSAYINRLKYLYNNSSSSRVDLSSSQDYKDLFKNTTDKIIESINKMTDSEDVDYGTVLKYLEESLKYVKKDSEEYKNIKDLYNKYEDKKPALLVSQKVVDYDYSTYGYNYSKTINNKEYTSYLSFLVNGKTLSRTYDLDKKYKTLKGKILTDGSWSKDFEGEIKIYGDDKEIYSSKTIKYDTKDINIKVDVSEVKNLKIEFNTKSSESSFTSYYIYLVEPYLYK